MNVKNLHNEYADLLPFFGDIPKTVLAAIAVSALTTGGDYLDAAATRVASEWHALHQAGIVPQKVSRSAQAFVDQGGEG